MKTMELYCEICDTYFECDLQLAEIHLEYRRDPETCHKPIMCNKCTIDAMILESQEICDVCFSDSCLGCDEGN